MTFLILLIVVAVIAVRVTTPDDRARLFAKVVGTLRQARETATRGRPECDAFRDALRERTPRAYVTIGFAALMALAVFAPSSLDALANTGLKTTNGEWWRLLTAPFVHAGLFQFLINIVVLVQLGFVLERLVGHAAFAVAFLTAGVFAGLINLSHEPLALSAGSSGAIFGLYGLLIATVGWSLRFDAPVDPPSNADDPQPLMIPRATLNTMGVWALLFTIVNLFNGSLTFAAEFTGFVIGAIGGAILARTVREHEPPPQHVTMLAGASLVIAFAFAVPLRGISDVRPEIQHVVAMEDTMTATYQSAAEQFRKGKLSADALAQVIDKTIVPQLLAADAKLKTFKKVPQEHQPMVIDAEEYLKLRSESWRLRAIAIRKTTTIPRRDVGKEPSDQTWRMKAEARHRANLVTLGNAEAAERTSLEAYQKVKSHASI